MLFTNYFEPPLVHLANDEVLLDVEYSTPSFVHTTRERHYRKNGPSKGLLPFEEFPSGNLQPV